MTRDELIKAIYDSNEKWSCPDHPCKFGKEKDGCMMCAENQLAEYEAKIRAEALKPIEEIIIDFVWGKIPLALSALRQILYNVNEQLKEQKNG